MVGGAAEGAGDGGARQRAQQGAAMGQPDDQQRHHQGLGLGRFPGEVGQQRRDRVLAIADMGLSPIKYGEGAYGEYLTYAESDPVPESGVNFVADGVVYPAAFGEDIYWQATTRGGRQVEAILANKAQFKDVTAGVAIASLHLADFALEVASWEAWDDHHDDDHDDDDDADEALAWAAGFALVGIGSMLMSEATTPEADTRYWDNLPAHIDYTTMPLDAHPTAAAFHDASGSLLGTQSTRIHLDPKGHCGLVYVKSRRAAEIPAAPATSA